MDEFDTPTALGYGWPLGLLRDGRTLYFDPSEWFLCGLLAIPVIQIDLATRRCFAALDQLPPARQEEMSRYLDIAVQDRAIWEPIDGHLPVIGPHGSSFVLHIDRYLAPEVGGYVFDKRAYSGDGDYRSGYLGSTKELPSTLRMREFQ